MLKKINHGRVESDEGYSIHAVGLELLEYKENDKKLIFGWYLNPETRKIAIHVSDSSCWQLPENKGVTQAEKERIYQNIKKAAQLLTGDFEVI